MKENDRARWNEKYCNEIDHARVNPNLIRHASLLKLGRILDLAGGLGQNGAWLAAQHPDSRAIAADISDEALSRAPVGLERVVADAGALPFAPHSFDTILNIRFFDRRVPFSEHLTSGGTVFFETYTTADAKYRPDFNPAYLFPLSDIPTIFRGLEILFSGETDDGRRVYVTVVARL